MSAWIEADVVLGSDDNPQTTAVRLNQWCLEHHSNADETAGRKEDGESNIVPHVTLLYHGHPASEEFKQAIRPFDLANVVLQGKTTKIVHVADQGLFVLSIQCDEMCDLFDLVYKEVKKKTGITPDHTLLNGYYKKFSPHITLAKYRAKRWIPSDWEETPAALSDMPVTIKNFRLYEWKKGSGSVCIDL